MIEKMGRQFKSFYTAIYGIRADGVHVLVDKGQPIKAEVYRKMLEDPDESLSEDIRIGRLFSEGEEVQSRELIERIKGEFECGNKAAYARLKKWKTGECRRGREVFYRKEHFVDSAPNEAVESRDYQERVVEDFMKELEEEGEDDGGDGGDEGFDENLLPGREELEKKFGLR